MSYSKSPNAVARVRPYLEELIDAQSDVEWEPTQVGSARLAYLIREGIHAARHLGLSDFASLTEKFIIRDRGNHVVAEIRNKLPSEILSRSLAKITLREVQGLGAVVGAAITHKGKKEWYFPDAALNRSEMEQLYAWTSKNEIHIIKHDEKSITLTRTNPGEIAWTPDNA